MIIKTTKTRRKRSAVDGLENFSFSFEEKLEKKTFKVKLRNDHEPNTTKKLGGITADRNSWRSIGLLSEKSFPRITAEHSWS